MEVLVSSRGQVPEVTAGAKATQGPVSEIDGEKYRLRGLRTEHGGVLRRKVTDLHLVAAGDPHIAGLD